MKNIVIAVSGKLGSGKDSFADIAVESFGFKKISLAGLLKEEVREFLNKYGISFSENNLYGSQADKEELISFPESFDFGNFVEENPFLERKCRDITFRYLLQLWGTEYRRKIDDDYWINAFDKESLKYDKVICSDLRFKNEFRYFKSIGAPCIRIYRPTSFTSNTSDHISEIDLDDIDINEWSHFIHNSASLDDYKKTCNDVLTSILSGRDR
jgi:hypothetical protein